MVMRKIFIVLFCSVSFLLSVEQVLADDFDQQVKDSRQLIKSLADELKSTLQSSMKKDGPVKSIEVCQVQAPLIAGRLSAEDVSVSRTSLKTRNSGNQPDDWERSVLIEFEKRKKQGELLQDMDFYEVSQVDGKQVFRYMKAIPTGDVCLKCHGSNIATPLAEKIKSLYPDDRATGFSKGDIRGAFSVTQKLP
jgi:hypothetical protein